MARKRDWTLTFRAGPRVERDAFSSLDDAVAEMQRRIEEVKAEGPLGPAKMFRQYEPGRRIHARAEISRGGVLRSKGAGVDLMGDGALVPFRGTVWRQTLDGDGDSSPFEAVREYLAEAAN